MAYLKSIFVVLCLLSVILMTWFIGPFSHPVVEHPESMYFYEYEPVYKQNFDFTLRERLKCEDNLFLVILVTSRLQELKARQAIRQTWGSQKSWWGNQVRTLFLLGQGEETEGNSVLSIEDESVLYGDILRQDFLDSYNNLTLKTIMGFRWVAEFCSNAHYVMKTDSDVFVNTGNLVKFLLSSNASGNFITGYPFVDNPALRKVFLKNYISYEDYPFKTYPPYLSGLGYVLDTRLAVRVYEMMSHIKPIKFEDVYVGLCLNRLGVNISMPEDTNLFFLKKISFDICKYKHLIAVHGIYPQEMITFWQEITRETTVTCS
ncbi:UDP-GalNAc:beta-1,3-N-acetylgalactosaminyltransferase 1 [Hemicordylus capensis]|uniref:UDP-GalNAc:beta-1, 3-N-acetylgalactosaminyltransferase 1 n=1 Tax=Hemicordylus capensis TaxID=884348 RepID=UPI00230236C4|nr:UDP-GalNAc:beta-1,3-N-acetylgalactosaminyltransferase 1 [Hemicordylus capensis]XP_053161729.1 UDP-GalNAc:beta-1,3-N-acetylgalactosaminyltransferase 1 [Hemicordylus capensis]XP_053161730.1 UDP-GalNAc:beta-1,3-N-acetylgalactosaminyltransferase 1 [Hemicordylus capensis]